MSSGDGSSPPSTGDQYRDAIEGYRGIVKWVISSFAAAAAALVAGIQLTSLGQLHGSRLAGALVSAGIAFVGVLTVIFAAVRVLVPYGGTYNEFAGSREFKPLREYLEVDVAPLRGKATDATDLADKYSAALKAEDEAWTALQHKPDDETLERAYNDARAARRSLFAVVRAVTALGLLLRTKRLFGQAIWAVYIGVAAAAAAAIAFAYLANPPKTAPAPSVPNSTRSQAVGPRILISSQERHGARALTARGCKIPAWGYVLPRGFGTDVLLVPVGHECPPVIVPEG